MRYIKNIELTGKTVNSFSYFWEVKMTKRKTKEKISREVIIQFLMRETGLTRQETMASIKELESFGLIGFNSNGDFRLKEV